jgi:large subunit ribosomal protein L25
MSVNEAKIACQRRTVVGSRSSRKLRYEGRMVGCIQNSDGQPNVDLHFDAREFETARRGHVHLFDLDVDGDVQSAVVNALQWDAFGDKLVHVEFRPVKRGVAIDSKVEIHFLGVPGGILQHILNEVMIRCIPSKIPDFVVARVDGLGEGTHIRAKDLVLPEGVDLAVDPSVEIAVISGVKVEVAPPPAEGEAPAAPGTP